MKRRTVLQASLGLGWTLARGSQVGAEPGVRGGADDDRRGGTSQELVWKVSSFLGLGTLLSIRAAHRDASVLERACALARGRIDDIEDQMSLFRPGSQLSQLNASGRLDRPGADLWAVLERSHHFSRLSGGSFDVTVQPLWSLYERCQQEGRLPLPGEIARARALVGWQDVHLSPGRVRLGRPGMALTLNGIAQGYATDQVKEVLRQHGIEHALINMGEWSALGRPEPERPWTLGVADPRHDGTVLARLAVHGGSVATSSDQLTTFSADHRHHHIFDPHTGSSPPDIASVTVLAQDCLTADAMTKVLFVAGLGSALEVAQRHHVQALVVDKAGRTYQTPGLPLV